MEEPIFINHKPITNEIYLSNNDLFIGPFYWIMESLNHYYLDYVNSNNDYILNNYNKEYIETFIFNASKNNRDIDYNINIEIFNKNTLNNDYINNSIDIIDNEKLKQLVFKMINEDSMDDTTISNLEMKLQSNNTLSQTRQTRFFELLDDQKEINNFIMNLPTKIINDEKIIDFLSEYFFNNSNYMESILDNIIKRDDVVKEIDIAISNRKNELEKIEQSLENEKTIASTSNINEKSITKIENENEILRQKIDQYEKLENLNTDLQDLEEEKNRYSVYRDHLKNEVDDLEMNYTTKTKELYSNTIIDEMLYRKTQEVLQSLKASEGPNYEKSENFIKKIQFSEINKIKELCQFIYQEFKITYKRNFKYNEIANILTCISCGFLTVFSGEPGTGKTTTLGLSENFVEIPVEKNWTSKRDFIGYFNSITNSFQITNRKMYNSIILQDLLEKKYENLI